MLCALLTPPLLWLLGEFLKTQDHHSHTSRHQVGKNLVRDLMSSSGQSTAKVG